MTRTKQAIGALIAVAIASPAAAAQRQGLRAVVTFDPASDVCAGQGQEGLFGAVAGVLLGPLVKAGINGLGSALQKAGSKDEGAVNAQTASMFYALNETDANSDPAREIVLLPSARCLTFAAGIGAGDGAATDAAAVRALLAQPERTLLKSPGVGFANLPSFYMTGAVELAKDRSAWRYAPTSLFIGTALTDGGWARGKGRDLVVTISMHGAGATATDAAVATRSIAIGRSLMGRGLNKYDAAELSRLSTGWMPLPPLSDVAKARVTAALTRLDDRKAQTAEQAAALVDAGDTKLSVKDREAARKKAAKATQTIADLDKLLAKDREALALTTPVTIAVDLHETRDGNAFVAAVGKFLSDNAETIAKPIAERIDPTKRTDAAIAAGEAEDKVRVAAITGVAAWQASKAAGESADKQRIARIGADAACRALTLKGFADPACLDLD